MNQYSSASFFYWSRVIRQEFLVKAGTMAVTDQAHFAEITSNVKGIQSNRIDNCAVIRSHGNEIEKYNGSDSTIVADKNKNADSNEGIGKYLIYMIKIPRNIKAGLDTEHFNIIRAMSLGHFYPVIVMRDNRE